MAARPGSLPPLTIPAQIQMPVSGSEAREPTFLHVATNSPDVSSRWITAWRLASGHAVLEVMGYRARRDLPVESWAFMRFMFSWLLALAQIVAILVTTVLATAHPAPHKKMHSALHLPAQTEYSACRSLASLNIVWLVKLVIQSFADSWFLLRRWQLGHEPVRGPPQLCPPNYTEFMSFVSFCEFWFVFVWTMIDGIKLALHSKECLVAAPRISIVAFTITALAVIYYLPTSLRLLVHRWQEPRADDRDEIEIGPLSQRKADRIPLVYYIPHPPAPAARPGGPVARFPQSFGRVLGRQGADSDLEGGLHNDSDWDKTFQRMPHSFLRLHGHEAKCVICLDDYVAPPRLGPGTTGTVTQSTNPDMQDAPQPLRRLDCGHTFHKDCLDRYITKESAKCPICRDPVRVRPPART